MKADARRDPRRDAGFYAKNTNPETLSEALDDTIPTVLEKAEATADERQFDLKAARLDAEARRAARCRFSIEGL